MFEKPTLRKLGYEQVERSDREQPCHYRCCQRHKSEPSGERCERNGGSDNTDTDGKASKQEARTATPQSPPGPHDEHDSEFSEDGFHEPRGLKCCCRGMNGQKQEREGCKVEEGAHQSETHHETSHEPNIPVTWPTHLIDIDIVTRDRESRYVGEEIVQQDLLGQQRQERQVKRGGCHADHVAEIGAGRDGDVLHRVGEGLAAIVDAPHQYAQVALEQDDVRGFARHIDGRIYRNADICFMERRRIVDAIAQIADHVAAPAQRLDYALFLVRVDLDEEIGIADTGQKPFFVSFERSSPVMILSARSPTASTRCAAT